MFNLSCKNIVVALGVWWHMHESFVSLPHQNFKRYSVDNCNIIINIISFVTSFLILHKLIIWRWHEKFWVRIMEIAFGRKKKKYQILLKCRWSKIVMLLGLCSINFINRLGSSQEINPKRTSIRIWTGLVGSTDQVVDILGQ